jgi:long-chain acyl-CoA synthetase
MSSNIERPWLDKYPKGVPHEINANAYKSAVDAFLQSCKKYPDLTAFINMGRGISYSQVDKMSRDFAAFLQNTCGLKKGDRIAIQMPNLLQYPIALFGALRAGLVVVNTNPLYTPREMEHQFMDSGVTAIVILANFASNLEAVLPKTRIQKVIITEIGDLLGFPKNLIVNFAVKAIKKMVPPYKIENYYSFREALARGSHQLFEAPEIRPDDIAFLQYTGGTTGVAKGAMLIHRNIVANMEQIAAWMSYNLVPGKEFVVTPLPMYHIFSLSVNCLAFMKYGSTNLLITNPRDIPAFVKEIKKYPITIMTGVNTLYNALLQNEEFKKMNFSTWKICVAGAMALQKAVTERWKKTTGVTVIEGFGLTETSPVLCCNPIDGTDQIGTIGLPLPSTDVKIMTEEGQQAKDEEPGEVWARGPQVMSGYWQRPDETKIVMQGEWFKTGDIGVRLPSGFFKIVDRKKDMILVSGFNVYPNEIEDVVIQCPGVLEVAAVGIADDKSGEAVKIFVVKKDQALTEAQILQFCKANLAAYKCPKAIEFKTELPKTNVGKILRRALRQ